MKRAAAASAALLLVLLAVLTIPVSAASPIAQVTIPITTDWSSESDRPYGGEKVLSSFTLTPLDGAPAPASATASVDGAGKTGIGPISFEQPGDYYYTLVANLYKKETSVEMTIRVTVVNEDGGLAGYVSAYDTSNQAQDGTPKKDTVFEVNFKASKTPQDNEDPKDPNKPGTPPDSTTPPKNNGKPSNQKPSGNKGVNTAAMSNLIFWLLLAIAAIILAGGLRRLSAEE